MKLGRPAENNNLFLQEIVGFGQVLPSFLTVLFGFLAN